MSQSSLCSLLDKCTVCISRKPGKGYGTGFFVAPGLILTCAHVVDDTLTEFEVAWNDKVIKAKLDNYLSNALTNKTASNWPDLALLKIDFTEHSCVLLHSKVDLEDRLYSFGYTDEYPNGEPATFTFEGISTAPEMLKFKGGQVRPGFSGAPLLNLRTGGVCGMVKASRDRSSDLGGRAISTKTILAQFKKLEALQIAFLNQDREWVGNLDQKQRQLLQGVSSRGAPGSVESSVVTTSVTVEDRNIILRIPFSEIPSAVPKGFGGPLDSQLVWLIKLIQSEERIHVTVSENDLVSTYLSKVIKKFSYPSTEPPVVTLALGSPTRDAAKWPSAGVYQYVDDEIPPDLIAEVDHPSDEAIFMWLVILALRRNQMAELAEYLGKCPKEIEPRLEIFKQKHWPSVQSFEAHLPQESDSREELPPVNIPYLGNELIRALLASQIGTADDLLASARVDFAKEAYESLSGRLKQLKNIAGSQPLVIRTEITLLQAVLDLAGNRLDEVDKAVRELEKCDLAAPLRVGLALLLLSKGDVLQARSVVSQIGLQAGESPELQVITRLITLWAKTLHSGLTGATRQNLTSEFLNICNLAMKQAGIHKSISLFLVHLALRLGETKTASELLRFAQNEYKHTAEFLHLSALVDIYIVIKYRQHNPDRNLDKSQKQAINRCLMALEKCISLATKKQLFRSLLSLHTNLGVALHIKASLSTGELRRQLYGKSAESLQQAALEAEDGFDLEARAANAWLLAGHPAKSTEIFSRLSIKNLSVDLQSNAATAFLMSGQPIEALRILERLSKQKAIGWQMLTNLAAILLVTGQPSRSISALEMARSASGQGRWRVDYLLSKAFLKLGQARRAEFFLRLAIEQRSFDPQLYREHLYCFQCGTVKDMEYLLRELEKVFELKKANKSILEELEQQIAHASNIYQESIRRYGGKKAQPGALVTHTFAEALEKSDALSTKLRALEEALSSRQSWPADALIERVQEITFDRFETSHKMTSTALPSLQPTESNIELKRIISSAERLLDTCSVPVALRSESINVLNNIETPVQDPDNLRHVLAVAARVIENQFTEPLKCYGYVDRIEGRGFQRRTVHRVFNEMHGRAILADEVGLGKTIESGLIFTEYRVRQMVKRCLILVPTADLKEQWLNEFTSKFKLSKGNGENSVAIQGSRDWRDWDQHTVSIATYQSAVSKSSNLRSLTWDMVIADEAHHLRNRGSASFKLTARLSTRYLLLLTATPLQKGIEDLYSLATLVRPSLFGPLKRFRAEYSQASDSKPRNITKLNTLLSQIMVRNTFVGVAGEMSTSRREFRNPSIQLSGPEMDFYREVLSFVLAQAKQTSRLPLSYYLLAREASSSPSTAIQTLFRILSKDKNDPEAQREFNFRALADSIETRSKIVEVSRIIEETAPRKVLIFVEFRTTAIELGDLLDADVVHGGLRPMERFKIVEAFRDDLEKRALVVTPAQGEGLNLEFCSVIINYDLPWNPMRIEQRIGRVQRIGQKEKVVTIYCLASTNTIEQEIRDGLVRKVRIFESVIGHIGLSFKTEKIVQDIESCIHEAFRSAKDEPSLRKHLAELFDSGTEPLVVDKEPRMPIHPPMGILMPSDTVSHKRPRRSTRRKKRP